MSNHCKCLYSNGQKNIKCYNLNLVVTENTFTSVKLEYKLTSTNTNNNGEVVPSINRKQINTGASTILLGSGSFTGKGTGNIHTYNLELYFPNTGEAQNEDMDKTFKAYIDIKEGFITLFDESKGVNKPVLATGMTPVVWNGTEFIPTTEDDASWYDYNAKQWANARTQDGSYWVWIPRYAYKITSGYHSSETGTIDIKFLKERTNKTIDDTIVETEGYISGIKDTNMHHFLHPAFQFNDEELGFWVAKYESSVANQSDPCYTSASNENCNNDTLIPRYIPNATSWRFIQNSNMFAVSEKMKNQTAIYGWNASEVDTHMMKNTEWGAVAYLSKSIYWAYTEKVWINSFNGYRTGCSGASANAASSSTCIEYHTENGIKASTTHTVYGVYDMSGGAWERTSTYVNNNHLNLTTNGANIINAQNKYKNIYSVGVTDNCPENYEANKNIYGDAIYETSSTGENSTSWFGNNSKMPNTIGPFFGRGGGYSDGAVAGVFYFYDSIGIDDSYYSWRPVVIVS